MLKGTAVSAGVAQGTAYVLSCGYRAAVPQRSIRSSEIDGERMRLDSAVASAEAELSALQDDLREKIGATQADIFGAQRLILGDASLRDRVRARQQVLPQLDPRAVARDAGCDRRAFRLGADQDGRPPHRRRRGRRRLRQSGKLHRTRVRAPDGGSEVLEGAAAAPHRSF